MPNERDNAHAADRRTQHGAWEMWGGAKKKNCLARNARDCGLHCANADMSFSACEYSHRRSRSPERHWGGAFGETRRSRIIYARGHVGNSLIAHNLSAWLC